MVSLIKTSPGLFISILLLVFGAIICTLVGFIMTRSGVSLRPIYWFAGFFSLVVLPQLIGHLYMAVNNVRNAQPHTAALQALAEGGTVTEDRADDAKLLFGPDADPQLIVDARTTMPWAFGQAQFARFAVLPNGETVLLARFDGYSAAEKAWVAYVRGSGFEHLKGEGDSQRGYVVSRPAGDRAYALHMGNMVGVWTGKDDAAIRERMRAGNFEIPRRAPIAQSASETVAAQTPSRAPLSAPAKVALAGGGAVYLLILVLYFFKGVAWAGSKPAKANIAPVAAAELADRLQAINSLDVPFQIEPGANANEFFATWRYADAKWIDLARARGMRRTFRIRLVLDAEKRVVRATDYTALYDWSVGQGGAHLAWKANLGVVLFQHEHERVYGLQLDPNGGFKPELSYSYTFNLQEMKSPLIEAVTRAGWTWRPTVWQGPKWLRWLTE